MLLVHKHNHVVFATNTYGCERDGIKFRLFDETPKSVIVTFEVGKVVRKVVSTTNKPILDLL